MLVPQRKLWLRGQTSAALGIFVVPHLASCKNIRSDKASKSFGQRASIILNCIPLYLPHKALGKPHLLDKLCRRSCQRRCRSPGRSVLGPKSSSDKKIQLDIVHML